MTPSPLKFYFVIALLDSVTFKIGYSGLLTECEYHVSPSLPTSFQVEEEFNKSGNVSDDGTYMTCHQDYAQCMVLWTFDQYDPNITTILVKGCWKGNGDCERKECIANDEISSRFLNNSRFCCCSSLRCNANFTYVWMPKNYSRMLELPVAPRKLPSNNYATIITVAVVGFVVLLVLVFISVCIFRSWTRNHDRLTKDKLLSAANGNGADKERLLNGLDMVLPQPKLLLDADQIELLDVISRGRFSIVWKSLYKTTGEYVAVKIYPPAYRQYYCNESRIYSWTCMDHENIVRFYGGADRLVVTDDQAKSMTVINQATGIPFQHQQASPQYWIVTAYMPQGTLQDFLKANTVDWEEMCKMGASIACGLSYLHGAGGKPPIVHRDVNSRNVLVKPDGTCTLCDFGFAMALEEPKPGSPNPHGDTPLTEVGTIRYFAPEILEGAVNLRDPTTALKQVDIYALGLVLWEIVSRCAPIYRLTDHLVPDYEPPFAKEISPHPTLEQMQLWVCKKKVRPLFPQAFYKFNIGALRVLRILVEDCWDSDSDARITASCAHERLVSLHSLAAVFGGTREADGVLSSKPQGPGELVSPYSRYLSYPELRRQLPYAGGESTVDTLATGATSGVGSMCLNSSDRGRSVNSSLGYHTTAADCPATLQPYQGRNPCMERNLLVESSDDSSNAKDRITESQFQKIDPCSPDTFARFASPALIALASRDDTSGLIEHKTFDGRIVHGKQAELTSPGAAGDTRLSATEKGNALAFLLMKSEKNRRAREESREQRQEGELLKANDHSDEPIQLQQGNAEGLSTTIVVDFRGSVSGSSNDSGNCTTASSRSGNSSANGSPILRSVEGKVDHRVPV